jgi:hypothetical protein
MTKLELENSGCENKLSIIHFKNGNESYGVISTFLNNENYQLATNNHMVEFKTYMDINNIDKMKTLCSNIDLNEIISIVLQ